MAEARAPRRRDPSVLFCGAATRDTVLLVHQLPADPRGGKVVALDAREFAAGMATSSAVAAARCGCRAAMCSSVGNDAAGRAYVSELAAEGVSTEHVRVVEGQPTAISCVLVGRDSDSPGLCAVDASWPPPADVVARFDAVLVDPRSPDAAAAVLRDARAGGVPSVLDADVSPDVAALRRLARAADHVAFSRPGLLSLLTPDDRRRVEASGGVGASRHWKCAWAVALRTVLGELPDARVVGVTLGGDGFVWVEAGGSTSSGDNDRSQSRLSEAWHVGAPAVNVVDTLSAGDVFHGVYALGVARGDMVCAAATAACAAAALKCERFGGRLGSPSGAELEAFLRAWGDRDAVRCGLCGPADGCAHCGGDCGGGGAP